MKLSSYAILLIVVLLAICSSSIWAQVPMPDLLQQAGKDYPYWVSADRAFAREGVFDDTLFHPSNREMLSWLLPETPPADGICNTFKGAIQEGPDLAERTMLSAALWHAPHVLTAKVTARSHGFLVRRPGTLLRVEPVETLKGQPLTRDSYYLFFSAGDFFVGSYRICIEDRHYPQAPEIGDHLLLIPSTTHTDDSEYLFVSGPTGMVTLFQDGGVSLPRFYRQSLDHALEYEQQMDVELLTAQNNEYLLAAVRATIAARQTP